MKGSLKVILGSIIVAGVTTTGLSDAHALASVDFAIKEICGHMMGNLGGLLMAAAGVGSIASAAFGNMKAMYSCLVTAMGAFGVSTVLSLHFQAAYTLCKGEESGGTTKVAENVGTKYSEVSKFNPEQAAKGFIAATNGSTPEGDGSENAEPESNVQADSEEESDMDLF